MEAFLLNTLNGVSDAWAYLFLFASAYIENVISPIPGDFVVIVGGYLVGIGRLNPGMTYAVTTAGSLAGFMTIFTLGYRLGRPYFERKNFRWFPLNAQERVERWFDRYGLLVIVANRFLSVARSVISLFAGLSRMPPARVALFALLSCAIWNALLIAGGIYLGQNWRLMTEFVSNYNKVAFALVALAFASWLVVRYRRRRSAAALERGLKG